MNVQTNKKKSKGRNGPVETILLPLEGTHSKPLLDASNLTTLLMSTNPTGQGVGASHHKTVRILDASDDVRSCLRWAQDMEAVFTGARANDVIAQVSIAQSAA